MKTRIKIFLILVICISLFLISSLNYFSSDDWFHLRISDVHSLSQFFNFFSFTATPESASFYRPLSTQVFFFTFYKLFGLNPVPYYLFGLFLFGIILLLIYRLAKLITNNQQLATLTVLFYGFSVTNFTRIYFLSAYQELFMVLFVLLSIIYYLNNKKVIYSLIFFVLALLSKETAAMLPLILVLFDWYRRRLNLRKIIPYLIILIPFLFFRLVIFKNTGGDSYLWSLSPTKAMNTLMWYGLWSLGAPELFVDYVGSGFRIVPKFFTDFPVWSYVILSLLASTGGIFILSLFKSIGKLKRELLLSAKLFILGLLPVLFLPWHKFTLELGLPMVGISLLFAYLVISNKRLGYAFIISFLALNLSMNYLTYIRHYSVSRSIIARRVYNFFSENYPKYPTGSYFEFVNDTADYGADWGSSKQISNTVSGSDMFRVLYHDPTIQVYYQDYPGEKPTNLKIIEISTKQFYQVK